QGPHTPTPRPGGRGARGEGESRRRSRPLSAWILKPPEVAALKRPTSGGTHDEARIPASPLRRAAQSPLQRRDPARRRAPKDGGNRSFAGAQDRLPRAPQPAP